MYSPSSNIPFGIFTDSFLVARLFVVTLAFLMTFISEKSSILTKAISNDTISGLSLGEGSVVMVNETLPFFSGGILRI